MALDAVAHFPGQVQSGSLLLQPLHHPQGLPEVGEAAGHDGVEQPLSRVAEGGVAQIVAQGDGLGQVLVQRQPPGDGPGNAADLQGVGHPGTVVVPLRLEEHLGLVLQPPEGLAVDDAVCVHLEAGAHAAGLLRPRPAPGLLRQAGAGGQCLPLPLFSLLSQRHGPSCPTPPEVHVRSYSSVHFILYEAAPHFPSKKSKFFKKFFIRVRRPLRRAAKARPGTAPRWRCPPPSRRSCPGCVPDMPPPSPPAARQ